MKIIMAARAVFPYHGYGGMQLYIYNLAKSLSNNGVEVEIVTSYMGKKEIFSEEYDGIKYTFLPIYTSKMWQDNVLVPKDKKPKQKGIIQSIRAVVPPKILAPIAFFPTIGFLILDTIRFLKFSSAVNDYLQTQKFDILHFYDLAGHDYSKKGNKPTVMQTFGNESFFDKRLADYLGYVFFRKLIRKSFAQSTIVGTCGEINAKDIIDISGNPKSKIKVMQNGITLSKIPKKTKQQSREELGIGKDEFVFITVNRLSPDKHVDLIINSYLKAKKKIKKKTRLVSIGSGIEEEKLRKIAKGEVEFKKGLNDEELYKHLRASDVFVNAADTRYLLLTVLEAMACSVPIITNFAMEKSVVSGKNGMVIPEGEVEMERAMTEIALKNLEKMSIEARKEAEKFDWDKIAKEDIKIYKELI